LLNVPFDHPIDSCPIIVLLKKFFTWSDVLFDPMPMM